ncbi:hypothetical protein PR202_gb26388 [Eleusine coracana subsp. coracana]|uniref:Alpha/beta hydrolase fold-3 domain-containing protein n=1 Tax=Eleusine coracana subsp. coracana TaxID=191504 RepID=A0AAV5FP21_ELECO|nr:hypothetical protein QOZ80_1BG0058820 [Eleusine coracana subsp. coracana]GJN37434.1 hypothetical protein PR202_gb26388 [Eleusine coracana subsp. coracana]
MSGDTTALHVVEDYRGVIQILSDGTILRSDPAVLRPPERCPDVPTVQWKDVVYAPAHGLKLRMYRPRPAGGGSEFKKLPVIVYFHSGGFCLGSFDQPNFHSDCLRLSSELPAVVLSADYRLGPEHRLPAAIDDAAAAVSWLSEQALLAAGAHSWLAESADFTRVFVAGESSGANMAHHVAVMHGSSGQLDLMIPLRISGYVLLTPFFGGAERTATEAEPPAGGLFTPEMYDKLWRMSLPVGATRDHPAANPFGPESPDLKPVDLPSVLVVSAGRDILRDRVTCYAARLKEMGKPVELGVLEEAQHAFFSREPWGEAADELIVAVKRFVRKNSEGTELAQI